MYKRLYQDRRVPDGHQDYSLITHDILGAQPKQWHDKTHPFFRPADAQLHINQQKAQYHDSITNEQSIAQQNDRYNFERKHFDKNAASNSEIRNEQLFYDKSFDDQNRLANSVFYSRNLETKDIEGTGVGTLVSKGVRNKDLYDKRYMGFENDQRNRTETNIHYPYGRAGDNDNTVDMPDYQKNGRLNPRFRATNKYKPISNGSNNYNQSENAVQQSLQNRNKSNLMENVQKSHPFSTQNIPNIDSSNHNLDSKQKVLDSAVNNYNKSLGHNDKLYYPVENNIPSENLEQSQMQKSNPQANQKEQNTSAYCPQNMDSIKEKLEELETEKRRLQYMVKEKEQGLKQARQDKLNPSGTNYNNQDLQLLYHNYNNPYMTQDEKMNYGNLNKNFNEMTQDPKYQDILNKSQRSTKTPEKDYTGTAKDFWDKQHHEYFFC